jgi:hypothetical protein
VSLPHATREVWVRVDVDLCIAELVEYLQTIPGVRTLASCQGTIGEGGPHPYRAQVMVTWDRPEALERLRAELDISELTEYFAYVHPKAAVARALEER